MIDELVGDRGSSRRRLGGADELSREYIELLDRSTDRRGCTYTLLVVGDMIGGDTVCVMMIWRWNARRRWRREEVVTPLNMGSARPAGRPAGAISPSPARPEGRGNQREKVSGVTLLCARFCLQDNENANPVALLMRLRNLQKLSTKAPVMFRRAEVFADHC